MKKIVGILLIAVLIILPLAACGTTDDASQSTLTGSVSQTTTNSEPANAAENTDGVKKAAICIPLGADEFFQFINKQVKDALEGEGYQVQTADANGDTQLMINQVQNFTSSGVDILYIFPSSGAEAFHDVMQEATNAGVKTLVSHNNTGENTATAFVQCDEFIMGTMMAPMVSRWLDKEYKDAAPGSVKVLALENSVIPDMVKRSTGMKIIGERFLRKVDLSTGRFVKTDGPEVHYTDGNGNDAVVDEPTGGLVLIDGKAILNPLYDERVKVLDISNRALQGNMDAQNALDIFFTANGGADKDVKVIMCYGGDMAAGASEKLMQAVEQGIINEDLSKLAVFGADITDSNKERMDQSLTNQSLIRGIMTNGNIIQTIVDTITKMARGEAVPAESWEKLGYMMPKEDGSGFIEVLYDGQLPNTNEFFD